MTVSVADHLAAVVAHLDGLNIGHGQPPATYGWVGPPGQSDFVRYGIVWRIGSKDRIRPTLDGVVSRANLLLYIRVFGPSAATAEQHLDAVADRMLDRDPDTGRWALPVPGRHVIDVRQDNSSSTTATETTEVGVYEAGEFFALVTDPA